jgi:hypothetical protein
MATKFLHDSLGKRSTMRIMHVFTVLVIMGTWAVVSIWTKTLQPLDPTFGLIVASSFGAKAWQKLIETKNGQ